MPGSELGTRDCRGVTRGACSTHSQGSEAHTSTIDLQLTSEGVWPQAMSNVHSHLRNNQILVQWGMKECYLHNSKMPPE